MAERNIPYRAAWADAMQHRSDPNRVDQTQVLSQPSQLAESQLAESQVAGASVTRARSSAARSAEDAGFSEEPSYYDISLLQAPVWKWQIACYFFFGGLSAGAYLLSRAAAWMGGKRYRRIEKSGTLVAFVSMLPCPVLLIDDLGDRKRFHHMLRVFKPTSPMNLGTFALTGYGGMVTAAMARQLLAGRVGEEPSNRSPSGLVTRGWLMLHDLLGVPFAIVVAGYTGVLLSCTSNPLWCRNRWLGPLFSASAMSTGAESVRLLLDLRGKSSDLDDDHDDVLLRLDTAAHVTEAVCLAGFTHSAGEKARPVKEGSMRRIHQMAIGALVASEVIKQVPVPPEWRRPVRILAAAAGLAAGFSMRWSMVYGGHEAANDPHLARVSSRRELARPATGNYDPPRLFETR